MMECSPNSVKTKKKKERGIPRVVVLFSMFLNKKSYLFSSRTPGSRQNSPTHEDSKMHMPHQPMGMDPQKMVHGRPDNSFLEQHPHLNHASGFQLDPPQFEPVGIDPIQFDYSSQLVSSMDSPNFNMDYNQQVG